MAMVSGILYKPEKDAPTTKFKRPTKEKMLEALQTAVGGNIQMAPFDELDGRTLLVNEEGWLNGMGVNMPVLEKYGVKFAGPVLEIPTEWL